MFYTHEDLEFASRQIRHAENLIENHQRIIDRLIELGQPTKLADRLMNRMRAGYAARCRHRDEIDAQLHGIAPEQAASQPPAGHA